MPKRIADTAKLIIGTSPTLSSRPEQAIRKANRMRSGGTCFLVRTFHISMLVAIFLLSTGAYPQKVVQPWEIPCSEEKVQPNLELKTKHHVSGTLKDQSGAPFAKSKVLLQRDREKSTTVKEVITDDNGHFDLGMVGPGKYRFLPAPNRGFKQPKQMSCSEGETCELNIVLEANPTDQVFAGCPIQ